MSAPYSLGLTSGYQVITRFIDDVEALGDIGALNMDAIAKTLAKNRSLYARLTFIHSRIAHCLSRTAENALLFYSAKNTSLTFYDATSMSFHATVCVS